MGKFTPGPWGITLSGLNENGEFRHQIGTPEKTIAYTWVPDEHNTLENEANARLIIQAPNLLDALKYLVGEIDPDIDEDYNPHAAPIARARAAISRATGETE